MSLGEQYIQIEANIFQLKQKKKEIDAAICEQETIKTSVKNQIVDEFHESGVCYDDLGLHVKKVPPKLIIQDENKIPESFFRVKKEIDKTKINAAHKLGQQVDGTTLDNGGYTVMFKPKEK